MKKDLAENICVKTISDSPSSSSFMLVYCSSCPHKLSTPPSHTLCPISSPISPAGLALHPYLHFNSSRANYSKNITMATLSQQHLSDLQPELEDVVSQKLQLHEQLAASETVVARQEGEVDRLEKQAPNSMKRSSGMLATPQAGNEEYDTVNTGLLPKVEDCKGISKDSKHELNQAFSPATSLTQELEDASAQRNEAVQRAESVEAKLQQALQLNDMMFERHNVTYNNINQQLEFSNKSISSLLEQNKGLKDDNKQLKEEIKELKDDKKQLKEEVKELKDENKQLKEEGKELKENNKRLTEQISHLNTTLTAQNDQIDRQLAQNTGQQDESAKLGKDLADKIRLKPMTSLAAFVLLYVLCIYFLVPRR